MCRAGANTQNDESPTPEGSWRTGSYDLIVRGRRLLPAWVLLLAVAGACGNSHSTTNAVASTSAPASDIFTGCNQGPPIPIIQKGESELLILFTQGTTAAQMDAVGNELLAMTRAGIESTLSKGLIFVGAATCDPPEMEVGYRSSLTPGQLATLEKRLLSEPRVAKVEPAPTASTTMPTEPASALTPAATTVYLRPVLCEIGLAGPGATILKPVTNAVCDTSGSSAASTPVNQEVESEAVILPFATGQVRYVLGPADLDAHDIASASVLPPFEGQGGDQIQLTLTAAGSQALDQVAPARYASYEQDPSNPSPQSMEAVEVGGVVESAPTFQAASFNGTVTLGEGMTTQQANALLKLIDQAIQG